MGLLTDLKSRGLLDSTLVIWGGEFGRTRLNEKDNGRDHNPRGFSMWMAGGGANKGHVIGTMTSDCVSSASSTSTTGTVLWCLGPSHVKVTYLQNGRGECICPHP